jgi:hypothetical protein
MMNFSRIGCVALVALLLVVSSTLLHAQNITGTITGTITDPSGAIVPTATVSITSVATKTVVRTVKADGHGVFNAPFLAVGEYGLSIDAPGFANTAIPSVTLNVGDTITENVTLKTGNASETVTVNASEIAPNTETPANSTVITE